MPKYEIQNLMYIFLMLLKFNRPNLTDKTCMRYKIQVRHPGTQEKQTILHQPITLHSTSHVTLMQEVLRLMSHTCGSYCSPVNKQNHRHFGEYLSFWLFEWYVYVRFSNTQ